MGYVWASGDKEVINSSFKYLYTSRHTGYISYGVTLSSFEEDKRSEYQAKIKVEFVEIQKPDTVELNGKTYLKSDLEEALAKLNPVG